jgi:hypothetical protein
MSANIEFMFAEDSSCGLSSRFRERYAKCRMALASKHADDAGDYSRSMAVSDGPCLGQDGRDVAKVRERSGFDAIDTMRGDRAPSVDTAAHFMTVFLEAYSAARQLSAG